MKHTKKNTIKNKKTKKNKVKVLYVKQKHSDEFMKSKEGEYFDK